MGGSHTRCRFLRFSSCFSSFSLRVVSSSFCIISSFSFCICSIKRRCSNSCWIFSCDSWKLCSWKGHKMSLDGLRCKPAHKGQVWGGCYHKAKGACSHSAGTARAQRQLLRCLSR